jgi:hypothetical protein
MAFLQEKVMTCVHCGIAVKHFNVGGTWTAWRHSAPCKRQCDPGGCETLDQGHYGVDNCSDTKCPVVAAA